MAEIDRIVEEWCERRDRGETIDVEALIADHPEYAKKLRTIFGAEHLLGDALRPSLPPGAPKTIGDYRIVREISLAWLIRPSQNSSSTPDP